MLSKFITVLVSPLGTALLLLLTAVLWPGRGPRRGLVGAALVWLWVCATPAVSDALVGWTEADAGPREVQAVAAAPVAVVLGGAVGSPYPPLRPYPDLGSSADRVWHAARLYHAGKAPRILLSGGSIKPGLPGEAHAMRAFLRDLGVPEAAIVIEDRSTDTQGNATQSAQWLRSQGIDRVILVTSASHMARARMQFERAGLRVEPAPVDIQVTGEPSNYMAYLPSADALEASGKAFKELVGRLALRVGAWVGVSR